MSEQAAERLPCGHLVTAVVTGGEGTSYCAACETDGRGQADEQAHGQDGTGSGRPQSGPSESAGSGSLTPPRAGIIPVTRAAVERLRREGKRFDLFDVEDVAWLVEALAEAQSGTPQPEAAPESRPNVEAPLIVWEYVFAVERQRDEARAAAEFMSEKVNRISEPFADAEARCVSLQEALQRIANQATDLPHARRIDRDEMRAIAREALAASEKEIPGGDPRSPVAEVGD